MIEKGDLIVESGFNGIDSLGWNFGLSHFLKWRGEGMIFDQRHKVSTRQKHDAITQQGGEIRNRHVGTTNKTVAGTHDIRHSTKLALGFEAEIYYRSTTTAP